MQPQFKSHQQVQGLFIFNDFINEQQEKLLIQSIKKQDWNTSLKRRTQHYGYQYSYDRKSTATKTRQLPEWCLQVKNRIENRINTINSNKGIKQEIKFDQMIVNQYQPGQGINPHIDNVNLFKDFVVSLSLGSNAVMVFQNSQQKVQVTLKRCSVVVLHDQSRFKWKHSIPSRKSDNGVLRDVRYSLTFRQMKL